MPLSPGARLGPYEILALIGSGGMGEVYKARDIRLDRLVAIKTSIEAVTDRFVREARAVAALNHPNIVAIYDFGESYIVTELVEGESLRSSHITPRQAIDIAAQIADGLAAAHAAGIVHRDLKPENVLLTREGRAKIVDFGLSRQAAGGTNDATRTLPETIMGTVGYMSPEQVRGEEADHRSDIFSFGAMLYELVSGRRAFTADTGAEVMTAILKSDPPEFPPSVPPPLRDIIRHCLEKEPAARFQSAKDLSFALRSQLAEPSVSSSAATPVVAPARPRRWMAYAAAGLAVAAAFAAAWFLRPRQEVDLAKYRFTPIASEAWSEILPLWSPDGKSIAYTGSPGRSAQIFVRRLDSPVADQITRDTAGGRLVFWSRTGDRIYYIRAEGLWSIGQLGGIPQKVADGVIDAALAPDGVTVAALRDGGKSVALGKLGSADWKPYRKPPFDGSATPRALAFSPDGAKLAVLGTRVNSSSGEIWLVPLPPDRGETRKLFSSRPPSTTFSSFAWMPDSRRLVVSLGGSQAVEQLYLGDAETGKLRQLTTGLEGAWLPSVSPDGRRIAYAREAVDSDVIEIMLDSGGVRPVLGTARAEAAAAWMPNGREFVYASDANGPSELWVRNAEDGRARPLLPREGGLLPSKLLGQVSIAPDGDRLAVEVWGSEHQIWALRPSGGNAARIDPENLDHHSPAWSPDGNWIAYARVLPKGELMKAPAGGGAPVTIAAVGSPGAPAVNPTGATEVAWSPAGNWIAWVADGLRLFSPDGKEQKNLGSSHPRQTAAFSRDGKMLYTYYFNPDEQAWRLDTLDVDSGRLLRSASFQLPPATQLRGFQMHPDGKRALATLVKNNSDIVMLEGF
ncbi:MAG TPA: protein kinase [Bryobacteraceae bacterium]